MAEPFTRLTAPAAALLRDNIDTDIIIPSREMKTVGKTGLAAGLFANWRYTDVAARTPNPDFVLNQRPNARVLLAGANFGCGSSREHAAWALAEWGIRAVIAPSFNPIFFGNAVRNGIVPVRLPADTIARLEAAEQLTVDLEAMRVEGQGEAHAFELPDEARLMLLEGLDAIDLTLKFRADIEAWRAADRGARPWAYPAAASSASVSR
jgi:3-isopropylmalate/(R)-2-methylmalate dehydratase small subunit